jgi:spermidine synthase
MGTNMIYIFVFFSGVSGLVYEVVWQRYLSILLGAQARATCIVLAIFLGGISLGYAIFGKWSRTKAWNQLRAYALIETLMGAWGLAFPLFFHWALPLTSILYHSWGVNNLLIDVITSTVLLLPPTFLMGGTLPLLTHSFSVDTKSATRTHAKIYGFNTLGACFGTLLAGYFLIPTTSLPFALQIAALINFVVAGAFLFLAHGKPANVPAPVKEGKLELSPTVIKIFSVAFLSGFYTITLETIFVRLMGLSTGSSNYNFTLIVSIFILAMGSGSLLARRIEDAEPRRLAWNQVAACFSLFLLYLSANYWSYGVHLVRISLRDSPENFYVYQAALAVVFTLCLAIPIGLAGLTMPLCFHLIKDRKDTLGSRVGQLYAVNTVGCVLGAIVGGYALLNYFNLDGLFKFCIFLCLISAAISITTVRVRKIIIPTAGIAFLVAVLTVVSPLFEKARFIQPFRQPQPISGVSYNGATAFGDYLSRSTKYIYYKDGPNTSVGVGASIYKGRELSRSIFINGKSDGNTRGDLFTTVMMGHFPALFAPKLDRVCVIGFGTGMTIGTFLQYDDVKQVDVVEISNTVIQAAPLFDSYDSAVTKSNRVHFHEMDAFRYLEAVDTKFDAIESEPSNPWVAGIENLYSVEFYEMAKRKLSPGGVFVQWIHTYSFNDDLFRMVLKTMTGSFPFVSVMQMKGGDIGLLGTILPITKADMVRARERLSQNPNAKTALSDAGIQGIEGVLALELVPPTLTKIMAEGADIHQLESPRLSNGAAKAFFSASAAKINDLRRSYREYWSSMRESMLSQYLDERVPSKTLVEEFQKSFCDDVPSKNSSLCEETLALEKAIDPKFNPNASYEDTLSERDVAAMDPEARSYHLFSMDDLQKIYRLFEIYKKYYSPLGRFPVEQLIEKTNMCMKTAFKSTELYGDCLLQKILMLEVMGTDPNEYQSSVNEYLSWFPTISTATSNYSKLKEARDIISHSK